MLISAKHNRIRIHQLIRPKRNRHTNIWWANVCPSHESYLTCETAVGMWGRRGSGWRRFHWHFYLHRSEFCRLGFVSFRFVFFFRSLALARHILLFFYTQHLYTNPLIEIIYISNISCPIPYGYRRKRHLAISFRLGSSLGMAFLRFMYNLKRWTGFDYYYSFYFCFPLACVDVDCGTYGHTVPQSQAYINIRICIS